MQCKNIDAPQTTHFKQLVSSFCILSLFFQQWPLLIFPAFTERSVPPPSECLGRAALYAARSVLFVCYEDFNISRISASVFVFCWVAMPCINDFYEINQTTLLWVKYEQSDSIVLFVVISRPQAQKPKQHCGSLFAGDFFSSKLKIYR